MFANRFWRNVHRNLCVFGCACSAILSGLGAITILAGVLRLIGTGPSVGPFMAIAVGAAVFVGFFAVAVACMTANEQEFLQLTDAEIKERLQSSRVGPFSPVVFAGFFLFGPSLFAEEIDKAWTSAAARPPIQAVGSIDWQPAAKRSPEVVKSAIVEPNYADIPFSAMPYLEDNGATQTRPQHLIEHGCPAWVAEYYARDLNVLNRIHGGYHRPDLAKILRVYKPEPKGEVRK